MGKAKANGPQHPRWVATPDGRVGLSVHEGRRGVLVQLGTDGPFKWFPRGALRSATQQEIATKEGIAS